MTRRRHDECCEHRRGDLTRKKAAYAAFGVTSYWIAAPDTRRPELSAFELTGGRYEQARRVTGDEVFRAARPFPVDVVPSGLVAGLHSR